MTVWQGLCNVERGRTANCSRAFWATSAFFPSPAFRFTTTVASIEHLRYYRLPRRDPFCHDPWGLVSVALLVSCFNISGVSSISSWLPLSFRSLSIPCLSRFRFCSQSIASKPTSAIWQPALRFVVELASTDCSLCSADVWNDSLQYCCLTWWFWIELISTSRMWTCCGRGGYIAVVGFALFYSTQSLRQPKVHVSFWSESYSMKIIWRIRLVMVMS